MHHDEKSRVTWGNVNYEIIQTIFKHILLKIAKINKPQLKHHRLAQHTARVDLG